MIVLTRFARINTTSSTPERYPQFTDLWPLFAPEVRRYFPADAQKAKTPKGMGAFSPAEFDGMGHEKKNVLRVHLAVLDIDGAPEGSYERVLMGFAGVEMIAYSTWAHHNPAVVPTHKPHPVSFRVVVPLSRPVEAREWPSFWAGLNSMSGDMLDPSTKDQSRKYYFPAAPGHSPHAFAHYYAGTPGSNRLDVEKTIERGARVLMLSGHARAEAEAPAPREQIKAISKLDLLDVAAALKKRSSPSVKAVAKSLEALVKGEVYGDAGELDVTLFKVCGAVADFYPNADTAAVVELLKPGIIATNNVLKTGDVDTDLEKVADKFNRLAERKKGEDFERIANEHAALREHIREAWAGVGEDRDEAYSDEELAGFANEANTTREGFRSRWIIQSGESYYVFVDGDYMRPIQLSGLRRSLRRDLAPAHAVVELFEQTAEGTKVFKPVEKILDEYATTARSTMVDLAAQRTIYDAAKQQIVEATCPIRKLTPTFDPQVDYWLKSLFVSPDDYEKVLDWIATVTYLNRPSVVLYLSGPRGVGKTLFAEGLARIWTEEGAAPLKKAVASFNEAVTKCPLIFGDEELPPEVTTTFLREFQQQHVRKLSRKFMPDAAMKGATRLIVAANNDRLLSTNEHLTPNDIDAIAERFLRVECSSAARTALEDIGGKPMAETFVTRDRMARHALWLRDNREISPEVELARFFMRSGSKDLAMSLTVTSGVRALVCQWLYGYLTNRAIYPRTGRAQELIAVRDGHVFVSPMAVYEMWETYIQHQKAPQLTKISDSIKGLSSGMQEMRIGAGGAVTALCRIEPEYLIQWATQTGVATPDEITRQLAVPTSVHFQVISGHETPNTPEIAAAAARQNPLANLHLLVPGGKA